MDTSQPQAPERKPFQRQIVVVGDAEDFELTFNAPLFELVKVDPLETRLKVDLDLVGKHIDLKTLLLARQCSLHLYETYATYEAMVEAFDETPYVFLNHFLGQSMDDTEEDFRGPYRSYPVFQAHNEFYTVAMAPNVRRLWNRFKPFSGEDKVVRDVATFRLKDGTIEQLSEGNFVDLNIWDLNDLRWESRILGNDAPYVTAANVDILFWPSGEVLNQTLSPEVEQMKTDPATRFTVFTIKEG